MGEVTRVDNVALPGAFPVYITHLCVLCTTLSSRGTRRRELIRQVEGVMIVGAVVGQDQEIGLWSDLH